jgi:hypothetical protein
MAGASGKAGHDKAAQFSDMFEEGSSLQEKYPTKLTTLGAFFTNVMERDDRRVRFEEVKADLVTFLEDPRLPALIYSITSSNRITLQNIERLLTSSRGENVRGDLKSYLTDIFYRQVEEVYEHFPHLMDSHGENPYWIKKKVNPMRRKYAMPEVTGIPLFNSRGGQ